MKISIVLGDITRQPGVDAIVNSANASLMPGSGVCRAIHKAAGPELAAACKPLAPISLGKAVITPGFALPNKHVIHVKGPHFLFDPNHELWLTVAVRNCLVLAEKHALSSVAFPAISTGAYKFPVETAAEIMLTTALTEGKHLHSVQEVRWVLSSPDTYSVFEQMLNKLPHAD